MLEVGISHMERKYGVCGGIRVCTCFILQSRTRHYPVLLQLERFWLGLGLEMAPSDQAQSHRLLAIVSCNHLEWLLPPWHQCFLGSWVQLSFRQRHLWACSLSHQPQHHLRHSGLPAVWLLAIHPCPAAVSMASCLGMIFGDVVFACW